MKTIYNISVFLSCVTIFLWSIWNYLEQKKFISEMIRPSENSFELQLKFIIAVVFLNIVCAVGLSFRLLVNAVIEKLFPKFYARVNQ